MKKIKRCVAVLLVLFLLSAMGCVPAFAKAGTADGFAEEYYRFQNIDGLLDEQDAQTLNEKLDEISHRQNLDVTAALVQSLDGYSTEDYADQLYENCRFGYGEDQDGVLLLVSLEERDWYIYTFGYGISVFTDAGIDYIGEQIRPQLADGNYLEAFEKYADQCDDFITQAENGEPYDIGHMPREPLSLLWIPISLAVGIGGALAVVGFYKSQLKTVHMQREARDYIRPGSMQVTNRSDYFLYRHVTRSAKPQQKSSSGGRSGGGSSIHTSSSGRSHGGGGGKF